MLRSQILTPKYSGHAWLEASASASARQSDKAAEMPPETQAWSVLFPPHTRARFQTAVEVLQPSAANEESLEIVDTFNLAMAIWGRDRVPPVRLFEILSKKDVENPVGRDRGANYMQCLAIVHAVLGNIDQAKGFLDSARKKIAGVTAREFSAWSYSKVTLAVFLFHLDEIEKFMMGGDVLPMFMTTDRSC